MTPLSQTVSSATDALERLSHSTPGERGRVATVVAGVLRAAEQALEERQGRAFCLRRAAVEVESLVGAERAMLQRLLLLLEEGGAPARLVDALVEYAYALERVRRLPEADAVMSLARTLAPDSAEVALHAGRVARRQGDRARALELYRRARELDGDGGALGRLAEVGEAVVSAEPEAALTAALARALCAHDMEAAAVALEERARVRREAGERDAAARDLCFAAARFTDAVDRARVAHRLADLFVAADDPLAAREALLLALAIGDGSQRDHACSRLHTVSRDMDDRVGMRRWRSHKRPALVSLSVRPRTRVAPEQSAAPTIARWRERLSAAGAAN